MKKRRKSFTLIELLLSLSILAIVLLAANITQLYFSKISMQDRSRADLYHNTSLALETILRQMRAANALEVAAGSLKLRFLQPDGTVKVSEYYLDAQSKELCYRPDVSQPVQYDVFLKNVQSFALEGKEALGKNRFRCAKVTLQAKDPEGRTTATSFLQSLAHCRIPDYGAVRLFGPANKTVKGYYDTIQEAINDASDGDEVQARGKEGNFAGIYKENITINKSLILKGSFNRKWKMQDPVSMPSVIDGQLRNALSISRPVGSTLESIAISEFIIKNSATAIYVGGLLSTELALNVKRCAITENLGGITLANCSSPNSNVTIEDCLMESNTLQALNASGVAGTLSIEKCRIQNSTVGNGALIFASGKIKEFKIDNSTIAGNKYGNYWQGPGGGALISISNNTQKFTISNSNISNNDFTIGSSLDATLISFGGGGDFNLSSSIIENNVQSRGTLYSRFIRSGALNNFSISNCRLSGNSLLLDQRSGFIWIDEVGNFSVDHSEIKNNALSCMVGSAGHHNIFLIYCGTARSCFTANTIFSGNNINGIAHTGSILSVAVSDSFSIINSIISSNGIYGDGSTHSVGIISEGAATSSSAHSIINSNIARNTLVARGERDAGIIFMGGYTTGGWRKRSYIVNSEIRNSIVYSHNLSGIQTLISLPVDYVYFSDIQNDAYTTLNSNINQDPLFVDAANGDFRLQAGSPGIDAGDPDVKYNDSDGSRNDMGAYGGPGAASGIGVQGQIGSQIGP